MKVRIIKCSDTDYWYKEEINKEFLVGENMINDFYILKNLYLYGGKNYNGLIHKDDCTQI